MYENLPTVSATERQQVLQAIERLQAKLNERKEWGHSERLGALSEALRSPLLSHILTLQHSVKQLKDQLSSLPADTCSDFSFSKKGQLIFSASRPPSSLLSSAPGFVVPNGSGLYSPTSQLSSEQLRRWIQTTAKGRQTEHISLPKPGSGGLGFSVVGLGPDGVGGNGVFIKQVQPGSIAHRDGRLQENDQILAINGSPLDQNVTQQQATALLQQASDRVELVVARDTATPKSPHLPGPGYTEQWGHVEEIELVNDGSGLGFGIVGGKATGVVVRTLVPGSVADKDGRLRTGDHILRIGDTPTQGLASDQVVKVLQGCGSHVRMLVARDPLGDPSPPAPPAPAAAPISSLPPLPSVPPTPTHRGVRMPSLEGYEIHEVALRKKEGQSLGISIVGCNPLTSENAVGVFIKHVIPGSAAEQSGNIRVHDRIIAMNGVNLQGFTNDQVLEVMKQTGPTVNLALVRKMASIKPLERSLDKVNRESSRVSLKRSAEVKVRSDVQRPLVPDSVEGSVAATRQQLARAPEPVPLPEKELRDKWDQALGPDYTVLVVKLDPVIEDDAELQKYPKLLPIHTMRLGVELDSFDGHHYISTVAPEGPVAKHGLLRPEDELLEVNGVQLYGKSRREAVAFLKEVPPPFTLVCCRHLSGESADLQADREEEQLEEWQPAAESVSVLEEMEEVQGRRRSPTPQPQEPSEEWEGGPQSEQHQRVEEGDDEEEQELALWSPEIHMLELEKGEQGLGFSILDYQDPLDPARSVIVIRSLVPGGIAEMHGGLLPGDQLVFVNDTCLDTCHLGQAVEALKAAPPGKVYLGIKKPLVMDVPEDIVIGKIEAGCAGRQVEEFEDGRSPVHDSWALTQNLAEGPPSPEELVDEPELILDGSFSLPRYTSPPDVEEMEMAVDEEGPEAEVHKGLEVEDRDLPVYSKPSSTLWEEPVDAAPADLLSAESSLKGWEAEEEEEEEEEEEDNEAGTLERLEKLSLKTLPFPLSDKATTWPRAQDSYTDSDLRTGTSEFSLTSTDTGSVHLTSPETWRGRGKGGSVSAGRGTYSELPEREEGEGEETPAFSHWGAPRRVEVWPEEGESLGISIVGGRTVIKRLKNGEELRGIFIKQVLPDSPAGRTQALKTGDKILEVCGLDLQNASHEEAVQAIRSAPSPVVFIVQSLSSTPRPVSLMASSYSKHKTKRKTTPEADQGSTPPPMRLPPPYRAPGLLTGEQQKELEAARGYNG